MVDYVPPEGVPLRWLLTYNETESEEDDGSWLGGTRRVFGRDAPMLYFCMVSAPLILFMLWKLKLCFRRRTGEIPAAWEVPGRAQVADGAPPAPAPTQHPRRPTGLDEVELAKMAEFAWVGSKKANPKFHTTECNICMDDFEDGDRIRELPCGHVYHAECVDEWLRVHPSCPVCRMDVGEALVETTTTAAAAAEGEEGVFSRVSSAVPPVRVALAGDDGEGSVRVQMSAGMSESRRDRARRAAVQAASGTRGAYT